MNGVPAGRPSLDRLACGAISVVEKFGRHEPQPVGDAVAMLDQALALPGLGAGVAGVPGN